MGEQDNPTINKAKVAKKKTVIVTNLFVFMSDALQGKQFTNVQIEELSAKRIIFSQTVDGKTVRTITNVTHYILQEVETQLA